MLSTRINPSHPVFLLNPHKVDTDWFFRLILRGLIILVLGFPLLGQAIDTEDLLDPDQAFVLNVSLATPDTLIAKWTIAEGYYLYRERFRFKTKTTGVTLGKPRFPAGQIKQDQFFGNMETYRQQVAVEIPLQWEASMPVQVELETVSQGCADIGVCYPPQTKTVALQLPTSPTTQPQVLHGKRTARATQFAAPGQAFSGKPKISGPLSAPLTTPNATNLLSRQPAQEQLLEPDQAFELSVTTPDPVTLVARWRIAAEYYLYRDRLKLTLVDADDIQIAAVTLPPGEPKDDEFFGKQQIYYGEATLTAHLQRTENAARDLRVQVNYQGCAERLGVCYPPQSQLIPITLAALTADATPVNSPPTTLLAGVDSGAMVAEQDRIAQLLMEKRFLAIPAFLGFGLLLALTPCVFPMIPILSSLIAGQGANMNSERAFMLSLVYVLAMASAYTLAGVSVALLGQNIQAALQSPWILTISSILFVLLALSMFGFYELQLPSRLQQWLIDVSNRQQAGSLLGVGVMGFLSALIVSPCVAPPLIGVLTVIGSTGDVGLGGVALFSIGLGMGLPLLLIGTSAGRWLPRAGHWMERIKTVFGVLLLGVALWLLERILPPVLVMLLAALLLIVSATYMGALQPIVHGAPAWRTLVKGCGVALLIYGILLLVGVAAGGRDVWQPLRGVEFIAAGSAQPERKLAFRPIKTIADLKRELSQARGRPVLVKFYADWCVTCKELEKYTFPDPAVQAALQNTVLLKADVTAHDEADQALQQHLDIMGPPALLFYDTQGVENRAHRVVGFMDADRFTIHVTQALAAKKPKKQQFSAI
ncbi:MAG: protein-disulfide reductase DsbD [Candidatus Competibacteraceae bacterium]|jgi:thiol:disulfide interchange protein DsbD|nr:protein-disulfide reductase DsbD [Candidatus Competibacteraceae bacterium]